MGDDLLAPPPVSRPVLTATEARAAYAAALIALHMQAEVLEGRIGEDRVAQDHARAFSDLAGFIAHDRLHKCGREDLWSRGPGDGPLPRVCDDLFRYSDGLRGLLDVLQVPQP